MLELPNLSEYSTIQTMGRHHGPLIWHPKEEEEGKRRQNPFKVQVLKSQGSLITIPNMESLDQPVLGYVGPIGNSRPML